MQPKELRVAMEKKFTEYDFFKHLTALPYIEAIYVYGSRMRGDADKRSDLDLAISCPEATEEEWQHIMSIIERAVFLLRVDCRRMDTLPDDAFKEYLLRTRVPVYVRNPFDFYDRLWQEIKPALHDFRTSLSEPANPQADYFYPAILQFRTTFWSFFRFLRRYLLIYQGIRTNTPVASLREAYVSGLIEDRPLWEELIQSRIRSDIGCTVELANTLMERLPTYLAAMEQTTDILLEKIRQEKSHA